MKSLTDILDTYFVTLIHPFKIHQEFRHQVKVDGYEGQPYQPLTLAESLGISWVFAILRGLGKIILINFVLNAFMSMQSESFPFLQDLMRESSVSTYYFLVFSAALDIIFFPIGTIVFTEVWSWVIRTYARWLNPDLPAEDIADQVTTHALSSNVFAMIPLLGDLIQPLLYYFLLYAGLRSNLGASKSLATVILLTPTIFALMLVSLFAFMIICLVP